MARPEAMRRLTAFDWTFDDYLPESEHRDGSLAHVQERVVSYAAAQDGYHTRTVATPEYIAISHTFLEFKYDQIVAPIQGYAIDARDDVYELVDAGRVLTSRRLLPIISYYVRRHHPRVARALVTPVRVARAAARPLRRSRRAE